MPVQSAKRNLAPKKKEVDRLLGFSFTALVVILFFLPVNFFETVQSKLFDLSLQIRGSLSVPKEIAIVAIDDASITKVGRWPWPRNRIAQLIDRLAEAKARVIALDFFFPMAEGERDAGNDRLLGEATHRAGNILYPFYFNLGKVPPGEKNPEIPPQIRNTSLLLFDDPKKFADFPPPSAREAFVPVMEIVAGAKALGHINLLLDGDGKVRWDPMIIEYGGQYFPSFGLQVAASAMGLTRGSTTVRVGHSIRLGKKSIPTNSEGMILIHYYGGYQSFPFYSSADVLAGKLDPKTFADKVVFVGVTAAGASVGVQDSIMTPLANRLSGVEKHAHVVGSIMESRFLSRPFWASFVEFGLIILIGILLTFYLFKMRRRWQLILSLGILAALVGLTAEAISQGIWIKILFPGLVTIFLSLLAFVRSPSAFPQESAAEMDFTKIAGPEEAQTADVERPSRGPASGPAALQKIGRYKILEELGHGAMGMVYKGQDPIIDRFVAIKTIRFDRFYEDREIQGLKDRFFKEVQAVGKLNHPNIVTVFDVGEDGTLSYMAMEYVAGESLSQYTSPNRLLPVEEVLRLVSEVARALDFAHRLGIVHRDVKPANIMLTPSGLVKVMDFGIAKLPTSTLTQTGSILGTPSYMSPEQINGQGVDGRSDLFSLGCVFYELLTGAKPFQGETLSALINQICQESSIPASKQSPKVPSLCDPILARALAKLPESRYQSGKEMAEDLRKALEAIKNSPQLTVHSPPQEEK